MLGLEAVRVGGEWDERGGEGVEPLLEDVLLLLVPRLGELRVRSRGGGDRRRLMVLDGRLLLDKS